MIKLALDTIDLVILRSQVDEAMSNKPVDLQQSYRLTRARDLLAECNTTVVLQ
jgi:transcriptional regulator GlxA family with amidase domain